MTLQANSTGNNALETDLVSGTGHHRAAFHGSIVALITPFHADGSIDYASLSQLLDWHIAAQTSALVIMGTTAESVTLSFAEQLQVIDYCIAHVSGRVPLILGNGHNATAEAVSRTEQLNSRDFAAYLTVTPYYNKPSQRGLIAHFTAIANAAAKPVILYNVPSRTGVDLAVSTVAQLAKHPNIIGIKDATGELARVKEYRLAITEPFCLLSGDDASAADFIRHGGDGVISVTANVAPETMAKMCQAMLAGNTAEADQLDEQVAGLHHYLFIESNPVPAKWALAKLGKITSDMVRLPLVTLEPNNENPIKAALQQAQLID